MPRMVKSGMDFFDQIEAAESAEAKLAIAKQHVCSVYRTQAEWLTAPPQGDQYFVFMESQRVYRVARLRGFDHITANELSIMASLEGRTPARVPHIWETNYNPASMCIERVGGSSLTPERLAAYPQKVQDSIALRFGGFIADMHGSFSEQDSIHIPWRGEALDKITRVLSETEDTAIRARLSAAARLLENYGKKDGPFVMSHNDLTPSNVFYDDTFQALSIIDFGVAKYATRYRDFVEPSRFYPAAFMDRVIEIYETRTQHAVNRSKIQPFMDVADTFFGRELVMRDGAAPFKPTRARGPRSPGRPKGPL